MKPRAAVILIQKEKIALIERYKAGRHYFVFPGGKIEPHESAPEAAAREAREELGLEVKIGPMVAEIWYRGSAQYYFLAEEARGQFGKGDGAEMKSLPGSEKGTYLPVWLPIDDLSSQPVLPRLMAVMVEKSLTKPWPKEPLVVTENLPDELD